MRGPPLDPRPHGDHEHHHQADTGRDQHADLRHARQQGEGHDRGGGEDEPQHRQEQRLPVGVQVQHHLLVLGQDAFREPHANLLVHECRGEPLDPSRRAATLAYPVVVRLSARAPRRRRRPWARSRGSVTAAGRRRRCRWRRRSACRPAGQLRPAPGGRSCRSGTGTPRRIAGRRRRTASAPYTSSKPRSSARSSGSRSVRRGAGEGEVTAPSGAGQLVGAQRDVEPDADHHGARAPHPRRGSRRLARRPMHQQVVGPFQVRVELGQPGAPPRRARPRPAAAASPSRADGTAGAQQDAERQPGARRRLPAAGPAGHGPRSAARRRRPAPRRRRPGRRRPHRRWSSRSPRRTPRAVQNPPGTTSARRSAAGVQRRALQIGVRRKCCTGRPYPRAITMPNVTALSRLTAEPRTSTHRRASSPTWTGASTRRCTPARPGRSRSSTPRARRPPGSGSSCCSTRARSSSSTSWPGTGRPTSAWSRTGRTATAWSPATAPSTAARSACSRRTSRSSAAASARSSARRSSRSWTWR